jgi:hypothetical protein
LLISRYPSRCVHIHKQHCVFRLTQPVFITVFQILHVSIQPIITCLFIQKLKTQRRNVKFCGGSIAEIAGSNPAGGMDVVPSECCVLSGRRLCVGLITRPEGVLPSVVCLSVIVKPR